MIMGQRILVRTMFETSVSDFINSHCNHNAEGARNTCMQPTVSSRGVVGYTHMAHRHLSGRKVKGTVHLLYMEVFPFEIVSVSVP